MCRWLAYQGPEIYLEDLIVKPTHSLLVQSRFARENYVHGLPDFMDGAFPTNGDGFGIGWYGDHEEPGRYRDLRPAWSDDNLISISANVRSGLFLAHLRAAYDGIVQRTNSHPFRQGRWLFQHNGEIEDFAKVRRALALQIDAEYYNCIQGTTDTEVMFYLALSLGLDEDPQGAMERMAGTVEAAMEAHGSEGPLRLTCALSDGEAIYAVRYASAGPAKTLYRNRDDKALVEIAEGADYNLPEGGQILLSEPLDDCSDRWECVPEDSFLILRDGELERQEFRPRRN